MKPPGEATIKSPPTLLGFDIIGWLQHGNIRQRVLAGLAVVVLVIILIAINSGGGSKNFNNPTYLAQDIAAQATAKLANEGSSTTVTAVCIQGSLPHQFVCNFAGSDGSTSTDTVTVSADGTTWISS